jgi:DNA mismatch repair protein MutS2
MRLDDYWGVGPKTSELLREELGTEAAIEAIESADVRTLASAGLSPGRATRILRRAHGQSGMDLLATRDARSVYKELLELAAEYAVTRTAADRIRVLTPLEERSAMTERLDEVTLAVDTWGDLGTDTREAVLSAFEEYDAATAEGASGDRPAVEAALAMAEAGVEAGVFAPIADLDRDRLREAADALAALTGDGIRAGYDDELDGLRESLSAVDELQTSATEVVDAVGGGARGVGGFEEEFRRHVVEETGVGTGRVREAMPGDAADATDFVRSTLRSLVETLRSDADERERELVADLEATVEDSAETVEAAVELVEDAALYVSLARFADAYDLVRPEFVEDDALAVIEARNLSLAAAEGTEVQPITYGIGDHGIEATAPSRPPSGDRVSVLTGANSGGKTTLLETLCQVSLLAQMGLPVPAERAEVSVVDAVVFHRRHASFNAGVLESTLQTIVPPLTERERTLMLVDEFEAITEPGRAADLLNGLVRLSVDREALGTFVTHLAEDLAPLPDEARTDGIFARGLSPDLELRVDYQPQFETVGKSTPEFIVSRLLANADSSHERSGFETLARAVGQEAVQRTLTDARWSED